MSGLFSPKLLFLLFAIHNSPFSIPNCFKSFFFENFVVSLLTFIPYRVAVAFVLFSYDSLSYIINFVISCLLGISWVIGLWYKSFNPLNQCNDSGLDEFSYDCCNSVVFPFCIKYFSIRLVSCITISEMWVMFFLL